MLWLTTLPMDALTLNGGPRLAFLATFIFLTTSHFEAKAAATYFQNRTAFESTVVPLVSRADFSGFVGSNGCNGFDTNLACGFGPVDIDFVDFTAAGQTSGIAGDSVELVFVVGAPAPNEIYAGGTRPAGSSVPFQTDVTFDFPTPITGFALGLEQVQGDGLSVTLLDGDSIVDEDFEVAAGSTFFGVESDVPFTSVLLEQSVDDNVVYTDIAYRQVPEPSAALLASAATCLMLMCKHFG